MFNPTISALLRGSWLIEEDFAHNSLGMAIGLLHGKVSGSEFLSGNGDYELPFFMDSTGTRRNAYISFRGQLVLDKEAAGPDSIAVVPFIGPMLKYDGQCGEPGMVKRQQWIKEMTGLPNVTGYLSLLDTPGGQADGTPQTAQVIKDLKVPSAALIVGQACSAGAWIASAHDAIYAADQFCEFGSVGAYRTIVDDRGAYEKAGYKIITIYPEVSKDKNASYRNAIDGDTTLAESQISDLAISFRNGFATNRGESLKNEDWNTGKVFPAKEAIKIGMIDGIKPMDQVLKELRSTSKQISSKKSTDNSNMKTTNVESLAGVESPSEEQLTLANAELTAAGILGATLVPESMIQEAATATAELNGLKTTNQTLSTSLQEEKQKSEELQTKLDALGSKPGASHKAEVNAGEQPNAIDADASETVLSNLSHNKAAEAYLS